MIQKNSLNSLKNVTQHTKFEGKLFLVGGYVRDWVLGRKCDGDYDIVSECSVIELADMLCEQGILDCSPVIYKRFGTVKMRLMGDDIEAVTARAESYDPNTRKPDVAAATLREDAMRRDFTINTLLYNIHTDELLDLTGQGMSDLQMGILRTPLPPKRTFEDDPLRILRAARFIAQLGFDVADELYAAAIETIDRLSIVSGERMHSELQRTVCARYAAYGLSMLTDWGVWQHLFGDDQIIDDNFEWIDKVPSKDRWPYALYPVCKYDDRAKILAHRLRFSRSEGTALKACCLLADTPTDVDLLVEYHKHLKSVELILQHYNHHSDYDIESIHAASQRSVVSPIDGQEIIRLRPDLPVVEVGKIKKHLIKMVVLGQIDCSDIIAAEGVVLGWQI